MVELEHFILNNEPLLRLLPFAAIVALLLTWEALAPRRPRALPRRRRWGANLGIVTLDTLLLRLLFPAAAVGAAVFAEARGWGLLPLLGLPYPLALLATVVVLDLVIYGQHRLVHRVPLLWRLHRVHHADLDYDFTTGLRFHPLEILLSMALKWGAILLLGPPVAGVILFEIVLNGTALFNHGNIRLPPRIDRWLRWLIVTPDMHRVHHSIERDETDSNFGFALPWWDRLFGSYREAPRAGQLGMTIGLPRLRDPARCATLGGLLRLPFERD